VPHHDDRCAVDFWRDVVIVIWRDMVDAAMVLRIADLVSRNSHLHPRMALLLVLAPRWRTPDSTMRHAIDTALRITQGKLACAAVVHESGGLFAASIGAAVTLMHLLSRASHKLEICPSVAAAAARMQCTMAPKSSDWAAQLERAVVSMRATSRARWASA
jgi:hypothetical protein